MFNRDIPTTITRLEDHPNLGEILAILAQLAHVTDAELTRLAASWSDSPYIAHARDRALQPGGPLVVEALAAMDSAAALFADEIAGTADWVRVPPETTHRGLNAIRDAIAAAYARPVLRRAQHALLSRPWRSVYRTARATEPDLGPSAAAVRAVLAAMPLLAARCHDPRGQELFDALATAAWTVDADRRSSARDAAWQIALLTGRRRLWTLVRRVAAEGIGRPCGACPRPAVDLAERDEQRVLALCADAACGLLVADAMADDALDTLTAPLAAVLPHPRSASEG